MTIREALIAKWITHLQPVLCPGETAAWDGSAVYTPQIVQEQDGYRMYYTGRNMLEDWAIGTATSIDLIEWTKHPTPVLLSGREWDQQIDFPYVINSGGTYLFYEAKRVMTPYPVDPRRGCWPSMTACHMYTRTIALATSYDGLHFIKHSDPVLTGGDPDQWDSDGVCAPRVYSYRDGYIMYYAGSDGRLVRSGIAFSNDFLHWKRYEGNPIIDVGCSGAWDSHSILLGSIVRLEDGWLAAYEGEDGEKIQIGLACSDDMMRWTRFEGNPIIRSEHSYVTHDSFVCAPLLIFHQEQLCLLYTDNATREDKVARIKIAFATMAPFVSRICGKFMR